MTPDDFIRELKRKVSRMDTLINRTLPRKMGNIAKRHFQDNFRQGGFVDTKPWHKIKEMRNILLKSCIIQKEKLPLQPQKKKMGKSYTASSL